MVSALHYASSRLSTVTVTATATATEGGARTMVAAAMEAMEATQATKTTPTSQHLMKSAVIHTRFGIRCPWGFAFC